VTERPIRVRLAPSPTGYFHIGSARTALFNWLFARKHAGAFILRIEDTDRTRYSPDAVDDLVTSLRWLGLDWDEGPLVGGDYGPYVQSERLALYLSHAEWLVKEGFAYKCYCSPERLESLREEQRKNKQYIGYDRRCRTLTSAQQNQYESEGIRPVIRLKAPLDGQTTFHDIVYGTIKVENATLDDLILLKSDGFPTYHLAVVVDDHHMEISHIMRGDEWLPTVPNRIVLYHALGWEIPVYAHLPLILAPTGKGKLSKRHGGVEVRDFHNQGYLPEAMVNYLARLGWSYDDKTEIFGRDELIRYFDLSGINNSPARFSYERLEWMNGYYIRQLDPNDLAARMVPFLDQAGLTATAAELQPLVPLVQERLKTLKEAVNWLDFFFKDQLDYDPALLVGKKMDALGSLHALQEARTVLADLSPFQAETIDPALRSLAETLGLKVGQLLGIIRIAVSGKQVAPPLFETLAILGQARTMERIDLALEALSQMAK
jgi:glutamyl-tRNA synthetase